MRGFLFGTNTMGFIVVAVYFLRFWTRTRDLLFLLFSLSFGVQAVAEVAFAFAAVPNESRPEFYWPRMVAYTLILAGIAHKNLKPTPPAG
jgi:hypothetical protein